MVQAEMQRLLQKYGLPNLMGCTSRELAEAVLLFLRNYALEQYRTPPPPTCCGRCQQ